MPIGAGLSAQIGVAKEVTVGTIVTPSRFYEFGSESLSLQKSIVQGQGLRAGIQYARRSRRAYTTKSAGGDVSLDVSTRGMGLLFQQMLGSSTSALLSGSTYRQIHTPGNLTGMSMTVQKGVPQTDGTVKPFTYNGCKVTGWELACAVGGFLTLSLTLDAWNETTATPLATAAYTDSNVFHFAQGTLYLGGTVSTSSGLASVAGGSAVATVKSATVTGSNPLKTDRFFFGSGVKAEQLENDYRTVGGSLTAEFTDQATIYDVFAADGAVALRLNFVGADAGGVTPRLEVLIPSISFDGESPQVGGPDVVELSAGFSGLYDGTNATVQVVYETADTEL